MAMNPKLKKALIIGVPAAGALIVIMVVASRGKTPTASTTGNGVIASGTTSSPTTSASASQLAAFEQSVGSAISQLSSTVSSSNTQLLSAITQLTPLSGSGSTGNPTNPSTSGSGGSSGGGSSYTPPPSTGTKTTGTATKTSTKPKTFAQLGYSWVRNYSVAQADNAAGEPLYFNATGPGGVPTPVRWHKGMKLPKNTTLYAKTGS